MSYQRIFRIHLTNIREIVRDIIVPRIEYTADVTVDCIAEGFVGLDVLVHNTGGTSMNLELNNQVVKRVPAGGSILFENYKIGLVKVDITGTAEYDLVIGGITLEALKIAGLI